MITKFTRLEFELFTKPSKSDFLRDQHLWLINIFVDFDFFRVNKMYGDR